MRLTLITTLLLCQALFSPAKADTTAAPMQSFPVSDVRLMPSRFETAQNVDIQYILALDADRLLAPYRKEAGLPSPAENYTNWENTGLDGHIGGHYLSALSYMWASTGNEDIGRRLDYMLSELKKCQDAAGDGYLCGVPGGRAMWTDVANGKINAGGFDLNGKWVPLYNIHKIYAGLRDAYEVAGKEEALPMLVALTDWMAGIVSGLSDEQVQDMLRSEHGGLNEIFADVAVYTGDNRYLDLARRFSHRAILDPLMDKEDKLTGMHANTQIPKVIGFKRIADVSHDAAIDSAAHFFWDVVANERSVSIGGNSVYEHFHPSDNFSSMLRSEQGPETCNTYNMLRLTKMLFLSSESPTLLDFYERALYNHILSSENLTTGGFVYFTPMRSGHYRVYSQPQTSFWCCVGSGLENHARYGEMIYSHRGDDALYVNLFIPSQLKWGKRIITQTTGFPAEEGTEITIEETTKPAFDINIRVPGWARHDEIKAWVNGKTLKPTVADGYINISHSWKKGDRIRIEFPMHLKAERLPDGSDYYSFLYGPIVLASNLGTEEQTGLFADDSRGGHIAAGRQIPLQEMPVIVGDTTDIISHISPVSGKPLTFSLSGVYPQKYEGMLLTPFYTLEACRYMVYWKVVSEKELDEEIKALAEEEKERQALAAITVDKVTCGEQQPESDHYIKMTDSWAGNNEDRHWRKAGKNGFFSYEMDTKGKGKFVRIALQPGTGKPATLTANGEVIGTIPAENGTAQFALPAGLDGRFTLCVKASDEGETPQIYNIAITTSTRSTPKL